MIAICNFASSYSIYFAEMAKRICKDSVCCKTKNLNTKAIDNYKSTKRVLFPELFFFFKKVNKGVKFIQDLTAILILVSNHTFHMVSCMIPKF